MLVYILIIVLFVIYFEIRDIKSSKKHYVKIKQLYKEAIKEAIEETRQ